MYLFKQNYMKLTLSIY